MTQCNQCNNTEIREVNESFLCVPLENDVENIFKPFYINLEFYCEICNALAENPQSRLHTGAVQKTQVQKIGQYLSIQFGRVVYRKGGKITYKVTIPQISNYLDKNLKLEAWIEHTGKTIDSGHYVTIRGKSETFIRMSDDHFTINRDNSIKKSELCYIALLNPF